MNFTARLLCGAAFSLLVVCGVSSAPAQELALAASDSIPFIGGSYFSLQAAPNGTVGLLGLRSNQAELPEGVLSLHSTPE